MSIELYENDIPADLDLGNVVAVDMEAMGLHHLRDRLCMVQLSSGDGKAHLVKFNADSPYDAPNLCKILTNPDILKIGHFIRADVAQIWAWLQVLMQPVYCTKTASKLCRTFANGHGLKNISRDLLGVELCKQMTTSDWGADTLSDDQLAYAADDVLYLHQLKEKLDEILIREGRMELAQACFGFIPYRAALDIEGWHDVDIFEH